MSQIINTNLASLNAQRNTAMSQSSLAVSMQRLSSGLRVNSAKDDAAGLSIAERMNAQVRGSQVAIRNANDGISLAQTAEGALSKVGDALQRMRDNGKAVLATSAAGTQTFQVGANTTANDRIDIVTTDMTTATEITTVAGTDNTGAGRAVIDNTAVGATIDTVIGNIDTALDKVNGERATLGASQNRFDAVISNLQVAVENQSASRSRIMDADFAQETANLSRAQILQQAGNTMVAQANQLPQQVLALLRQ
ncbi:MAG: flagellin FliC [Burkholderiales bacterium]|nr:flagellin FliC [Burkholderiales bacterium]